MIPHIQYNGKTIVLWLIYNSRTHTNSLRNGDDTRPLLTMPEKTKFLNAAADNDYYLFLEHAHNEIVTVQHTEKRIRLKEVFKADEILR
jgi:hypothetical protein